MRYLYSWIKFASLLASASAIFLIIEIWVFLSGNTMPIDLISPSFGGYPILDYIVPMMCLFFALSSFAFTTGQSRDWRNFLFAIPLAFVNLYVSRIWYQMERGYADIYIASILLTFVFLCNIFASALFVSSPFRSHIEIQAGADSTPDAVA